MCAPLLAARDFCGLAGRPSKRTASQNVDMQMGNRFSTVTPVVNHYPITRIGYSKLLGDFLGSQQKVAQQRRIFRAGCCDSGNRFLGNHQNMYGSLRISIMKGDERVVFIYDFRRDLAGDNFFENSHRMVRRMLVCRSARSSSARRNSTISFRSSEQLRFHLFADWRWRTHGLRPDRERLEAWFDKAG